MNYLDFAGPDINNRAHYVVSNCSPDGLESCTICWNCRLWEIPIPLKKCKSTLNIDIGEDNREK